MLYKHLQKRAAAFRFTLIELLVVIAIIAILASMLLPALSQVKETGQASSCMSIFNQVGKASMLYRQDWNDYYPGFYNHFTTAYSATSILWYKNLKTYMGTEHKTFGGFEKTAKACGEFICPKVKAKPYTSSDSRIHTIGLNTSYSKLGCLPISKVKYPSALVYMGEVERLHAMVSDWMDTNSNYHIKLQHQKKGNVLYADGHTEQLYGARIPYRYSDGWTLGTHKANCQFWYGRNSM